MASCCPSLTIAYETYGRLAADGRNAALATHGYTSSHHAAGRYRLRRRQGPSGREVGTWAKLIGPGKAIDTDRLFVVSSNALGSPYGSTNPAALNPATASLTGPIPPIRSATSCARRRRCSTIWASTSDRRRRALLRRLPGLPVGRHLPEFMHGIVPAVTAPKNIGSPHATQLLLDRLAKDPSWNGGWYYDRGGVSTALTQMRIDTLKFYGIEAQLVAQYPEPVAREAAILEWRGPGFRRSTPTRSSCCAGRS